MGELRPASVIWIVLSIAFGWTIFVYWWALVLRRNDAADILYMVAVVILLADAIVLASYGWIAHNKKLARRGSRGRATAFLVPRYDRDRINRKIVLPNGLKVQSYPVVRVRIEGGEKIFEAATTIRRAS